MKEANTGIRYSDWNDEGEDLSDPEIEINVDVDEDSFEDEEWQEHKPEEATDLQPKVYKHNHIPISEGDAIVQGSERARYRTNEDGRVIYGGIPGFKFRDRDDPRHYGRCWALCYYNGNPLVIIGPDCKPI